VRAPSRPVQRATHRVSVVGACAWIQGGSACTARWSKRGEMERELHDANATHGTHGRSCARGGTRSPRSSCTRSACASATRFASECSGGDSADGSWRKRGEQGDGVSVCMGRCGGVAGGACCAALHCMQGGGRRVGACAMHACHATAPFARMHGTHTARTHCRDTCSSTKPPSHPRPPSRTRLGLVEPTWEEVNGDDPSPKVFDEFFSMDPDGEFGMVREHGCPASPLGTHIPFHPRVAIPALNYRLCS
jgi:hypothetical protein